MQSPGGKFTREERNGKLDASDRIARASVATALWAVSTCECITELDRPQAGGRSTKVKKAPARFSRALAVSTSKTTLSLRPRRSGGSRFLLLNHSRWLGGQDYFAHDNSIANC
jgi:hypothetical protein